MRKLLGPVMLILPPSPPAWAIPAVAESVLPLRNTKTSSRVKVRLPPLLLRVVAVMALPSFNMSWLAAVVTFPP